MKMDLFKFITFTVIGVMLGYFFIGLYYYNQNQVNNDFFYNYVQTNCQLQNNSIAYDYLDKEREFKTFNPFINYTK